MVWRVTAAADEVARWRRREREGDDLMEAVAADEVERWRRNEGDLVVGLEAAAAAAA